MSVGSSVVGLVSSVVSGSRVATRLVTQGLTVFFFHDVTDQPSPFETATEINTPPQVFRKQLEWIARTFEVIGCDQLDSAKGLPTNGAIVTFDDSWAGTFTNGFSILEELSIPATAFVNFCTIDQRVDAAVLHQFRHGPDSGFPEMKHREDRPKDFDDFQAFQGVLADDDLIGHWDGHPLFRLGSHLYWHVVSQGASDADLTESYLRNRTRLSSFTSSIDQVSFPFGQPDVHFGDHHSTVLRRLGVSRTYSARARVNRGALGFTIDRVAPPQTATSPGLLLKTIVHREVVDYLGRS